MGVRVFLAGGAMRDMLAGFRIGDLDFVVELGSRGMAAAGAGCGRLHTYCLSRTTYAPAK
jgi:hypothetical protein